MDAALELIVSVYDNPKMADEMRKELKGTAQGDVNFKILNAAVLVKDEHGHLKMKESDDVDAKHGALFGAITGGLIGLLGGPGGVVVGALAGAATGGVTAAAVDLGFPNEQLKELRASLPYGSSALVVLVEHTWLESTVKELNKGGNRLFHRPVDPATAEEFERKAARH
jgi:uncharacterized membrane protein